jgi:hypothetical protein
MTRSDDTPRLRILIAGYATAGTLMLAVAAAGAGPFAA